MGTFDVSDGEHDPFEATETRVLVVEDNPTTVQLLRRVLEDLDGVEEILSASDGVEAIEMLEPGGSAPPVDLVLLDLGLPRKDGHEVLEELREDLGRRTLPVVVVSSSRNPDDVEEAYELGANGYIRKPTGVEGLRELAESLESFWLRSAVIPEAST